MSDNKVVLESVRFTIKQLAKTFVEIWIGNIGHQRRFFNFAVLTFYEYLPLLNLDAALLDEIF